jgi:ABC-type lipoprotein release transport system permease subunit
MLLNYLLTAWRNLHKQKLFSLINLAGLTLGLAVCLLIVVYVQYERGYDRFNAHYETLYRVAQHQNQQGTWYEVGRTPAKLAAALHETFPEVKNAARFRVGHNALLSYGRLTGEEPNGLMAEPALFAMFTFPFVRGEARHALAGPHSIVLTERLARKYFGTANPVGRVMLMDRATPLRVTGVLRDIPAQSHLQFDYVVPLALARTHGVNLEEWGANVFYTYVQLHDPAHRGSADRKLTPFAERTFGDPDVQFYLQPLADIHLHSRFDFNSDFGKRGDIRYVRFFAALALAVLLLACLNFINLSTARALERAKEVGLRKTLGARRRQLVIQFIGESTLVVGVAGTLALALAEVSLPCLADFTGKPLGLPVGRPQFWLLVGGIFAGTSLVAGSYPAFMLSAFRPAGVLYGQRRGGPAGGGLRRGLVIGQFTLSVTMITLSLLMYRQLHFVSSHKLGIGKDNVVYVPLKGALKKNLAVARQELLQQPGVASVSAASHYSMPFKAVGSSGTGGIRVAGRPVAASFMLNTFGTDYGFVETMGLELVGGRSFSPAFGRDTTHFILNQAAVKRLGLKQPLGAQLDFYGKQGQVVGVVRDFHFTTLKEKVEPALLQVVPGDQMGYLLIRIHSQDIRRTIAAINAVANRRSEGHPVEARFLSEDYQRLYGQEQTAATLFNWFTGLAILISGLGLLGLATFTTRQRTKEIGIRKVLGASVGSIVALLAVQFMKLIGLAILCAGPLACWAASRWLQSFAYRVPIGWGTFVLSGLIAAGFALCIVGVQAVRTAASNPVNSLRNE